MMSASADDEADYEASTSDGLRRANRTDIFQNCVLQAQEMRKRATALDLISIVAEMQAYCPQHHRGTRRGFFIDGTTNVLYKATSHSTHNYLAPARPHLPSHKRVDLGCANTYGYSNTDTADDGYSENQPKSGPVPNTSDLPFTQYVVAVCTGEANIFTFCCYHI